MRREPCWPPCAPPHPWPSSAALATALAGPALAAGPTREIEDLDDPALGHRRVRLGIGVVRVRRRRARRRAVDVRRLPGGLPADAGDRPLRHARHVHERRDGYAVKLRDIGPDRVYIRDGVVRIAVTGRAVTSQGIIGQIVFDPATGDVVFQAGREPGLFYDTLCDRLASASDRVGGGSGGAGAIGARRRSARPVRLGRAGRRRRRRVRPAVRPGLLPVEAREQVGLVVRRGDP